MLNLQDLANAVTRAQDDLETLEIENNNAQNREIREVALMPDGQAKSDAKAAFVIANNERIAEEREAYRELLDAVNAVRNALDAVLEDAS